MPCSFAGKVDANGTSMRSGLRKVLSPICNLCLSTILEMSVEPEKHIHAAPHASKVTRTTAILTFSVVNASHKDLASGGECGVELRSHDWRHDAERGLLVEHMIM
jgi:hypothetical protein